MVRMATAALLALSILLTATAHAAQRSVEQVVRSSELPKIEVAIDPSLRYLGSYTQSAMGGKAEFEQYVFADARQGTLGRVLIVHFEHVVPGVDFEFDYPRLEMVRLGRHEYLHQSWPIEKWALFDSPAMKKMLGEHGLVAPATWLVDRYVRAVDPERRAEIILFYLEPATTLPAPVDQLGLGGAQRELWQPIASALASRARAVFQVRD